MGTAIEPKEPDLEHLVQVATLVVASSMRTGHCRSRGSRYSSENKTDGAGLGPHRPAKFQAKLALSA
jgi:hypothetical protein